MDVIWNCDKPENAEEAEEYLIAWGEEQQVRHAMNGPCSVRVEDCLGEGVVAFLACAGGIVFVASNEKEFPVPS